MGYNSSSNQFIPAEGDIPGYQSFAHYDSWLDLPSDRTYDNLPTLVSYKTFCR